MQRIKDNFLWIFLGVIAIVIFSPAIPVRYASLKVQSYSWETSVTILTWQQLQGTDNYVPNGATVVSQSTHYDTSSCQSWDHHCLGDPITEYTYTYYDWAAARVVTASGTDQNVMYPGFALNPGEKQGQGNFSMIVWFKDAKGKTYEYFPSDVAHFQSYNQSDTYVGTFNIWGTLLGVR